MATDMQYNTRVLYIICVHCNFTACATEMVSARTRDVSKHQDTLRSVRHKDRLTVLKSNTNPEKRDTSGKI